MKKIIEVKGLEKKYAGRTVLNHIDLTICEGEIFGLLGANGSET